MKGTATAATFNGVNWLSATATTPATFNLVSSFSRVGGTPTIGSITLTIANYSLYTSTQTGILDKVSGPASVDTIDISAIDDSAAQQTILTATSHRSPPRSTRWPRPPPISVRQEPHLDQHGVRQDPDGLGGSWCRSARRRRHERGIDPPSGAPDQQQLGVQALSIANQNSQSILSLFR